MKILNAVFLAILASLAGCSAQTTDRETSLIVLNDLQDPHFRYSDEELSPGDWVEEGGSMICRGYLVRIESEDYCSAKVPNDWEAFTYDGQTYYLQPLSGK